MRVCEVVYVNTGDVEALPGDRAKKHVRILPPHGYDLIEGWELGVDSDWCDVPGVRISAQLRMGPPGTAAAEEVVTDEVLGDYLYRSPGRSLRGAPVLLPAPYRLEGDEPFLFVKVTNNTDGPIRARANIYVWWVKEEE